MIEAIDGMGWASAFSSHLMICSFVFDGSQSSKLVGWWMVVDKMPSSLVYQSLLSVAVLVPGSRDHLPPPFNPESFPPAQRLILPLNHIGLSHLTLDLA